MGKGRQKIAIRKIEDISRRRVAFSKRSKGICGKAKQLSTMTGCRIAFLTFTSAMKPLLFGDIALLEQAAAACAGSPCPNFDMNNFAASPGFTEEVEISCSNLGNGELQDGGGDAYDKNENLFFTEQELAEVMAFVEDEAEAEGSSTFNVDCTDLMLQEEFANLPNLIDLDDCTDLMMPEEITKLPNLIEVDGLEMQEEIIQLPKLIEFNSEASGTGSMNVDSTDTTMQDLTSVSESNEKALPMILYSESYNSNSSDNYKIYDASEMMQFDSNGNADNAVMIDGLPRLVLEMGDVVDGFSNEEEYYNHLISEENKLEVMRDYLTTITSTT